MSTRPSVPPPGFDQMSPAAQLDYINALWNRVLEHPETVPVPDWHREIVGERLEEYRSGRAGTGRPWSEVKRDLEVELSSEGR